MRPELWESLQGTGRSSAFEPVFEVISGLHAGVIVPLETRRYTIGSSLPADIILHDAGVAPEHAALLIDRQRVRLEALGGAVDMQTGRLPAAHGSYLQLPIDIVLGEATIRVRLPDRPQPADGWTIEPLLRAASRRMSTRTGIGIVSALALCLAGAVLTFSTGTTKADADGMAPILFAALGDASREKMTTNRPSEPPRIDDVVRDLTARLDAAGLHVLKAAVVGDRLTVTGELDKREAETWTAVQQWFDQTYGRQFILGAHVSIAEAKTAPPLSLQAVWYGANPYVIAADGTHYYEGTVLQSGWAVREIGANRVMLVRNGESLALAY
jgi:Inner membrane component of T3SS, cytoplasmic domain/Inner membrane component of T3SS, periplasmic domain